MASNEQMLPSGSETVVAYEAVDPPHNRQLIRLCFTCCTLHAFDRHSLLRKALRIAEATPLSTTHRFAFDSPCLHARFTQQPTEHMFSLHAQTFGPQRCLNHLQGGLEWSLVAGDQPVVDLNAYCRSVVRLTTHVG